jgi:hypothetical protein
MVGTATVRLSQDDTSSEPTTAGRGVAACTDAQVSLGPPFRPP